MGCSCHVPLFQDKVLLDYWAEEESSNVGAAALLKKDFDLVLTIKQISRVKERVLGELLCLADPILLLGGVTCQMSVVPGTAMK